ncbi:MAG: TetR/AcrR family transcriptional regulator [Candidatus Borkfalkiaceae bacterium]|nr:TetR/AcrR family transcriptional regulator [Christensenellaceae bacterium]
MEKGNTKREILSAALDLFSEQGFESTSLSQIAAAVGIRKASLYSHFGGKQEILDALVKEALGEYENKSVFAKPFRENDGDSFATCEEVVNTVKRQIAYILHDDVIRKARKMLGIEQFTNAALAALLTKQNYSDVMRYFTDVIKTLQQKGVLSDGDAETMAAQFCLPVTVWINLCDRKSLSEAEIMRLTERHVRQFFAVYRADGTSRGQVKE